MANEELKAAAEHYRQRAYEESNEGCYEFECDKGMLADWAVQRLAADEADPIRRDAIAMLDICLSADATDDERSMAANTILEAAYPSMLAEHVRLMECESRRLAADSAERAERERPIDEAWLRSIGWYEWKYQDSTYLRFRLEPTGPYDRWLSWLEGMTEVWALISETPDATVLFYGEGTRGQLLDLLRCLGVERKGGG